MSITDNEILLQRLEGLAAAALKKGDTVKAKAIRLKILKLIRGG